MFSSIEIYLIYYLCAFREVAKAVARIIALALDLEVDFFDKPEMLGEPIATLRLLHYEGEILKKFNKFHYRPDTIALLK